MNSKPSLQLFCLLASLATVPHLSAQGQPDILIADFEGEDYGDWVADGEAFGSGPAKGGFPRQQKVSGYEGERLVNSFLNGDRTTGSLTSPTFSLERDYLRFLIGGGSHQETALQLLIDGEVVASRSGFKKEPLSLEMIDLRKWSGRQATLRIVDRHSGGWGHINVDSIVLTDVKPDVPKRITQWNIGQASAEPYLPGPFDQSYREDWRPQFHFSPRVEWMNDINALIYEDGTYHMLYQWGKAVRHGGYATSKDLLHWDDKGVALVPQRTFLPEEATRNVSGDQVFSGSGVWVEGETAKKITGSEKPALVTHYTGTKVGTCIAWSNDGGGTWHNYKNNPVAHPTDGAVPRDPCVIWYQPTTSWILGIYDTSGDKKGTALYGSKDLIQWERLSFLDFGFECPDILELPLDGDPERMKWVIYDASGQYLVGQFDGKTFTGENDVDGNMMDLGPDFYAGQSFFPHNLPEEKYIQIAWMDEWNGGIGEEKGGWHRNATFPVELGLVTRDGKMRVTRTPIPAIKELYTGQAVSLSDIEVGSENVLKDIRSKAFDATLTLDLNGATAKEIVFSVTHVDYRYDIAKQRLSYVGVENNKFGSKEPPVLQPDSDNKLTLRLLVDWSSIEIFSDDGVFSFSQQVAFDPKDDELSLKAIGGKVKLESLILNPIQSVW